MKPPSQIVATLQSQFLGIILNWCLFGILVVQVYIYSLRSKQDRLGIRALVYGVFILDVVHTALLTHMPWTMLISQWGDTDAIKHRPWSALAMPVISGILSSIVQIFFAWRVWALSMKETKWSIVAGLIVMVALAQSAAAYANAIGFATHANDPTYIPKMFPGVVVWLAGSLVCDIMITASMMYLLNKAREDLLFGRTQRLLGRLIALTLETGLLTTVGATLDLGLYLGITYTDYHIILGYVLGKLYSNALLATLNARSDPRRGDHLSTGTIRTIPMSSGTRKGNTYELSTSADIKIAPGVLVEQSFSKV